MPGCALHWTRTFFTSTWGNLGITSLAKEGKIDHGFRCDEAGLGLQTAGESQQLHMRILDNQLNIFHWQL